MQVPKYEDVSLDMEDMLAILRLAAEILDKHRGGGERVSADALRADAVAWENEVMDEWDRVESMSEQEGK